MKTINERFKEVKDYFDLSVSKFAQKIGISQPSAKAIMDGKNEPSYKAISGLAKGFPMISIDWLVKGVGAMLCSPEGNINAPYEVEPKEYEFQHLKHKKEITEMDNELLRMVNQMLKTLVAEKERIIQLLQEKKGK